MEEKQQKSGDLVWVYRPATQVEAHSFAIFLQEHGIPAVVNNNEALQGGVAAIAGSPYALSPEVLVNREDREDAGSLIAKFEQITRQASEIESDPNEEKEEPLLPWKDWPRCPECSTLRITQCPDCGETGDNFLLADYQGEPDTPEPERPKAKLEEDAEPEDETAVNEAKQSAIARLRPFVVCPECAHAFRPVFNRLCSKCDHIFDDGRYPRPADKKRSQSLVSFIVGVVILIIAFATIYFIFGPKPGPGPRVPVEAPLRGI